MVFPFLTSKEKVRLLWPEDKQKGVAQPGNGAAPQVRSEYPGQDSLYLKNPPVSPLGSGTVSYVIYPPLTPAQILANVGPMSQTGMDLM